jgi:cation diffusion facilitator CzcD-associated flavoprotein CzcO
MKRVGVIGAGPSGIAAARACLREGHETVVYEKSGDIGGNWVFREEPGHSSVYETTHIISSKAFSQYEDFPMPDDYPDYPSHRQLAAYFQAYARTFGVERVVRFHTEVVHARHLPAGGWELRLRDPRSPGEGERVERVDALLVANGHHWDPVVPEVPGRFAGTLLHSHAFKRAAPFAGQRVVVVGAGNSACDIAVETSRVSARTFVSIRRGQHIIPKFIFGVPNDVAYAKLLALPRALRQPLLEAAARVVQGRYAQYGLPEPEVGILEMHPTLNSELLYFIRHGEIHVRRGIERFDGDEVVFVDGVRERADTVIFATGYRISFPFFDPGPFDWAEALAVPLYRKMIHADYDDLYFIGLFQPLGCIWPLADHQGRLAARAIAGKWRRPRDLRARIAHEMANPHYRFQRERRHATEVDYHQFRRELLAELAA